MNPEQALQLFAQIINQTKFTLQEGDAVRQAYTVLNDLVQRESQAKTPQLEGGKESNSKI